MNQEIKPVLDEIGAVLKKHDMVGIVIVGNRTHCDWRLKVDASWSCAWMEQRADGATGLRIRSKRKDYGSEQEQKACMERTLGTLVTMNHVLSKLQEVLEGVLVMVSKSVSFIGKSTEEE